MIEHLVISSGGPHIIVQLGMLAEAIQTGIIDQANIKTIHGCSSGSILGTFLCLGIPIQDVVDYVVNRTWKKCVHYDIHNFYVNKGILDNNWIYEMLLPFFKAYDVPLDITMSEMYKRTGIYFDILTTEVVEMKSIVLNHNTFPDLPIITAVKMSSAVPVVFPPVPYLDKLYIDGVCRRHCPMVEYPEDSVCIFSIDTSCHLIPKLEDVTDYFQYILMKSYRILTESECIPKGRHFSCADIPSVMDINLWRRTIEDSSYRAEMIEVGRCVVRKIEPIEPSLSE